ncbi:sulfate transporter 4.1 [Annulohypoxylon maeteangense]|uniref:sulfate transporter 4.1 n=1 Tax=Annulohypoxylon maeteangense TaxID=1927788 RepID=UPI0020086C7D|nr:sulfate transporter 4.1 [Annulohypoxylon maeteangense]KAI0889454.1 sulfate transporter 4.1 [Annulohypoxylon maeteangense]
MERHVAAVKKEFRTDVTVNRVAKFARTAPPKFPSAARQYLLDKLPIIEWIPRYSPPWLLQDFMAGLTIGVLLIPQGLAYAKIATIPIENGLYSCWVPAAVMVFMGTSKDLSTGPTSILGLLTAEIIRDLKNEYTPVDISSAVAMMVGIWSLLIGLLGLGFLLDYVSIPVLTGFISATAFVIGMGQVASLVGLSGGPDGAFNQLGDALKRLPHWDGPTCGIGFGTILILLILQKIGQKWGHKHFAIKYMASSRAIIVMVIFTLISYLVNKDRDEYLWGISQVNTHGIQHPKAPSAALLSKVVARSIAPLVACTLEHQAVGKAFGRRNHYAIDPTQEFNYLGVTNIVNAFFGAMPVGGAISRTAVNSECHVKSPLNGVVTAGFIILTLYVFSPALYWLPKSTLAAIIIMAVIHLFGPLSLIWRYWRISLADFIACMVSFWITIFVSAEIGIGAAAGWSVAWTLLRSAFAKPTIHINSTAPNSTSSPSSNSTNSNGPTDFQPLALFPTATTTTITQQITENIGGPSIPEDTVIVRFADSLFFPNANRNKVTALEAIQLAYPSVQSPQYSADAERMWSVAAERRLARLRVSRGIVMREMPLAVVVWDFGMVPFVDATGVTALAELKDDVRRQLGFGVQIRIVGMAEGVRARFARAGWRLVDVDGLMDGAADVVYPSLERAIWDERDRDSLKGVTTEKV